MMNVIDRMDTHMSRRDRGLNAGKRSEDAMSQQHEIKIRFPELNLSEAGKAARALRETIEDESPDLDLSVEKDDPTNMDFGATLAVVIGTPAVLALARGIALWLARKRSTLEFEIDGDRVTFRAEGSLDENTARIVEALSPSKAG